MPKSWPLALGLAVAVSVWSIATGTILDDPFPEVQQHTAFADGDFSLSEARRNLQARVGPRAGLPAALRPGPRGSGFWSTRRNIFVDAAGRQVYFSGVIWSGFETPDRVVQGLWRRSYLSHLDQMKSLGFNLVRIPFSGAALAATSRPRFVNYFKNRDLRGLNSLQVMDRVIAACRARGMKVILDYHRVNATVTTEGGLWWDRLQPPQTWLNNWIMLVKRYRGLDTVIGADLFNEIHDKCTGCPQGGPFWTMDAGPSEPNFNVRTWAAKAALAIQTVEPRWIVFIAGMYTNYWWGGNVAALLNAPLQLRVPNKLAYSAHENGPYTFWQPFYNVTTFPNNLIPLFRTNWGGVHEKGVAPVVVASFGSFYRMTRMRIDYIDRTAFQTLIRYIRQIRASWTVAHWGFDSRDQGGILNRDWATVNVQKIRLLQSIMHPGFGPSPGQQ